MTFLRGAPSFRALCERAGTVTATNSNKPALRGDKLTETDQAGRVTQYQYDLAGQLTRVTYALGTPDAASVQYTYDAAGRKKTVTDERNNVTTYNYDDAGRLTSVVDALNHTTTYGYDADDRRSSTTDGASHTTHFAYDARSRLTTVTYPDTTTASYTYDGMGRQLTATDQAGKVTTNAYDAAGQLTSVTDALNHATQYAYDLSGNLTGITDANNHATSFQYDALNRRTVRTLPLNMSETTTYDAVGNMSTRTDFNGRTTTFSYDTLNRLLSKAPDPALNQPTIRFTYNPTGTRATMVDATGTTNYTYDNRDRMTNKVTPEGTLSYTYDTHSNVLTIASSNTNGGSMTYTYDALNRLATVVDNRLLAQGVSPATTTYSYDVVGNLASYSYPNGVQTSNSYDALNRLTQVGSLKTGTLSSFGYTLGPAGNRLAVAELGGRSVTYGYDNVYRLTSEAITSDPGGNNGVVGYAYDPVSNRTQRTSTLGALPAATYTYDANDRIGGDTFDYNGNTISSAGISYAYDFENRLTLRGAVTVAYDGDGNRVSETAGGVTTKYLIDSLNLTGYSQVLDELVSGSVTRTYAYGLQRISENQLVNGSWVPSFYGYDGHGNVRFLASSGGTLTDTYTFDAFGAQIANTGTTPNRFRFGGEQLDNNLGGTYDLRARWYRPDVGRFLTRDSDEEMCCSLRSSNPYVYADADPANRVDPTGNQAIAEVAQKAAKTIVIPLPGTILFGASVLCEAGRGTSIVIGIAQNLGHTPNFQLVNLCWYAVSPEPPAAPFPAPAGPGIPLNPPPGAPPDTCGPGEHRHHMLPQAFRQWFADHGANVDDPQFIECLPPPCHIGPGGVHSNEDGIPGTNWNALWAAWISANSNATVADILQFLNQLKSRFQDRLNCT